MSTHNQMDLQPLGSQPVIPKNLPDHWACMECTMALQRLQILYAPFDPQGINLVTTPRG